MNTELADATVAQVEQTPRVTADDICKVLVEKKSMLLGLILRYENDWETAEDILATASMEALANAEHQFKGDSSLASYIGSIAVNAARKHARRQATRKNSVGLYYDHEIAPADSDGEDISVLDIGVGVDSVSPEKSLENAQTLSRVQQAMARIEKRWPDAYRTWQMHRLEELSYLEIQEQTGVEQATARSHVSRVSKELEKITGINPKSFFS